MTKIRSASTIVDRRFSSWTRRPQAEREAGEDEEKYQRHQRHKIDEILVDRQVVARVKAVLRRTSDKEKVPENECLKYETLSLDTKRIKASVDGQEVPLTKKEFEILKLLLENKGNVFSREEILSRIWKDEVYVLDRTIDVNITRLRKKIGPYGKNIVTRLGFGYFFEN